MQGVYQFPYVHLLGEQAEYRPPKKQELAMRLLKLWADGPLPRGSTTISQANMTYARQPAPWDVPLLRAPCRWWWDLSLPLGSFVMSNYKFPTRWGENLVGTVCVTSYIITAVLFHCLDSCERCYPIHQCLRLMVSCVWHQRTFVLCVLTIAPMRRSVFDSRANAAQCV